MKDLSSLNAMALYLFLFTGDDMAPKFHRYIDANIANYKRVRGGFRVQKRRPSHYVRADGTRFVLKKISWRIPWHIIEMTMNENNIEALNNDTREYCDDWGTTNIVKGDKWRASIKEARKAYLNILLKKQKEGKILCIVNSKVWGQFSSGNLITIIEEERKHYITSIGGMHKRRYPLALAEYEGISWLED